MEDSKLSKAIFYGELKENWLKEKWSTATALRFKDVFKRTYRENLTNFNKISLLKLSDKNSDKKNV